MGTSSAKRRITFEAAEVLGNVHTNSGINMARTSTRVKEVSILLDEIRNSVLKSTEDHDQHQGPQKGTRDLDRLSRTLKRSPRRVLYVLYEQHNEDQSTAGSTSSRKRRRQRRKSKFLYFQWKAYVVERWIDENMSRVGSEGFGYDLKSAKILLKKQFKSLIKFDEFEKKGTRSFSLDSESTYYE